MIYIKIFLTINALIRASECSLIQIHRAMGKNVSTDGSRKLAICAKRATNLLFTPSLKILVLVDDRLTSAANEYLRISSIEDRPTTIVGTSKGETQIPIIEEIIDQSMWDQKREKTSYVIIANNVNRLCRIFDHHREILPVWSEYLIVTTLGQYHLQTFGFSLTKRGYLRFAFVQMNETGSIVLQRYDNLSRKSTFLDRHPELQNLGICETIKRETVDIAYFDNERNVKPLSTEICPLKGCQLVVGYVEDNIASMPESSYQLRREYDIATNVTKYFCHREKINWRIRSSYDRHLNWSMAFDLIKREEIDIAYYGSFVPGNETMGHISVAAWYDFEELKFVDVSIFANDAPLIKVFSPLDIYSWLCIIALIVIYSLFAIVIGTFHRRNMVSKPITLFDIWSILFGAGIKAPVNIGLRTVIGMWMMSVLFINAAYSSGFKSSLASIRKFESFKTFRELSESARPIIGTAGARQLFAYSDDPIDHLIYNKWQVTEPQDLIPSAIRGDGVVVDYYSNVKHNNLDVNKNHTLYALEEPVLVYPLFFYLKKSHPYVIPLRRFVSRLRDSGIIDKWCVDHYYDMQALAERQRKRRTNNYADLDLSDMEVAFKIWAAGITLALVAFIYENLVARNCCTYLKKRGSNKISDIGGNAVNETIFYCKMESDFRDYLKSTQLKS